MENKTFLNRMSPVGPMQPNKVLVNQEEIKQMVQALGRRITEDYAGKEILLVGVLKGAFVFMADLVRAIDLPVEVDFMAVSSYGRDTRSSGIVKIIKDLDQDISGKHVIIVEDIVDSGLTLKKLMELITTRNPKSLQLCAAFDKPSRRTVDLEVKYCGISIPDEFIVGYGLDYRGHYRQLDQIYKMSNSQNEA